jgi:hypothetical protein
MRKIIICGLIGLALGLPGPRIATAQGTTTFLSNLGQTPDGSNQVGSDSWLSAGFVTGANPGGYVLNSVQLGLAAPTGNPSGFTVMIYSEADIAGASRPVSDLGTLVGNADPATAGNYSYAAQSSITLTPGTEYYVVMTAGTSTANGAFAWNFLNSYSYDSTDGWEASVALGSGDGSTLSWTRLGSGPGYDNAQFAINATPAPEPGVVGLLAVGGLIVAMRPRRESSKAKVQGPKLKAAGAGRI